MPLLMAMRNNQVLNGATRHVAVDLGEGFAEGFDGQVFHLRGFDHLQHHVEDGVAITLQKDSVRFLVAFDGFLNN